MTNALIILGKGESRTRLGEYLDRYPAAALWTLNNFFPDGTDPLMHGFRLEERTNLHFDVHYDQRFWPLMETVRKPWIVSPFRIGEAHAAFMATNFPLAEVYDQFGFAYFESSLCYMLAYAALVARRSGNFWSVVCLPGVDFQDPTHFAYRFGVHYWLGVLTGMGVRLEIPRESACLQRFAGARCVDTETDFPHIYGQPWDVTEPHRKTYNWNS